MEDSVAKPQATPSGANPSATANSPVPVGNSSQKSAPSLPDTATKPAQSAVSPIAARSWWVALLAALPPLAMLFFLHWNPYLAVLTAAGVTIAVSLTWGGLSQAPSPGRTGLVVVLAGIGCLLAAFLTNNLTWVPLVLSWCLLAAFIAEMTRGKHRT